MIFKDKISVRNCKYTKNIIYFNDAMIKLSYNHKLYKIIAHYIQVRQDKFCQPKPCFISIKEAT